MNESIVQWTLLNNLDVLSGLLNFKIAFKRGQEISTDFGRIDFVLENYSGTQMVVELETKLDNKAKLDYCFDQVKRYKNVSFSPKTEYCILYASETKLKSKRIVCDFGKKHNVAIRTYSIDEVKILYVSTVEKLSLSFGLVLPSPKTYTICHLRWLNKILKPFDDYKTDKLSRKKLARYFTSPRTTNFKCYLKLALDCEMITQEGDHFIITRNGKDYIKNFNIDVYSSTRKLPTIDLTNEQKKVLLRVITNGNWKTLKGNIYWFLRFVEITNGQWLPRTTLEKTKLDLVNGLFGVNYKSRTMSEFLKFVCTWCTELGLVERIKTKTIYDKVYLTPLGVEINNIFSLDLQLKKSRLNLNFKYLD